MALEAVLIGTRTEKLLMRTNRYFLFGFCSLCSVSVRSVQFLMAVVGDSDGGGSDWNPSSGITGQYYLLLLFV
ncbi:hypothetical protein HanIR_Chr17g0850351 [Helianthus annuus]|nr:hypothetical protein HanIR_Chr17g0850351 [Helianthus annuus]